MRVLSLLAVLLLAPRGAAAQGAVSLTPVSGADGVFEVVTVDGQTVYRAAGAPGAYQSYVYFQADGPVPDGEVYVAVDYLDVGWGGFLLQYNASAEDYAFATDVRGTYRMDTGRPRTALFRLPDADFRGAQNLGADLRLYSDPSVQLHVLSAEATAEAPGADLGTAAASFALDDRIVSTSVFHWYVPSGGQLSGPWVPLEGRIHWDGTVGWWRFQVQQMMAANVDVLYVHLIPQLEFVRVNLFRALRALREEGYDVPKVAPFLDPLITWHDGTPPDLATEAGKDELASHYVRFFEQYFAVNPDQHAADYLARIDGRVVLDTWHVFFLSNVAALTREDLESRLRGALDHPVFDGGIYMVTTGLNNPVFSFADERVPQFEINAYYHEVTHNGITAAQLKGGYWDQNVRDPGDFLPRDGGGPYAEAWAQVDADVDRVYVESWNEYDEGTGIYAAQPGAGVPTGTNPNTDVWSASGDPFEYVRTTAAGAAAFNETPALGARVLAHTLPASVEAGATVRATVTVRNEGDAVWSAAAGFAFGPVGEAAGGEAVPVPAVPVFDGVVRGRPVTFDIEWTAPDVAGTYAVRWSMLDGEAPFGDELAATVEVTGGTAAEAGGAQPAMLLPVAPNPASGAATVRFRLAQAGPVRLEVYDALGRRVAVLADGERAAGFHAAPFEAEAGGVYVVRLEAGGVQASRSVTLLR